MIDPNVLIRAKALIDHPNKWCRGWLEHRGRKCMIGAIRSACDDIESTPYLTFLTSVIQSAVGRKTQIYKFNDAHRHRDVMRLFDLAIDKAIALELASYTLAEIREEVTEGG